MDTKQTHGFVADSAEGMGDIRRQDDTVARAESQFLILRAFEPSFRLAFQKSKIST